MKFKKIILVLCFLNSVYSIDKIYINNEQTFEINNMNSHIVEVTISINEIILDQITLNGETYAHISIPGSYPSSKIGYPNLPMLNKLIEVPRESEIRVEIIEDNIKEYNGKDYTQEQ